MNIIRAEANKLFLKQKVLLLSAGVLLFYAIISYLQISSPYIDLESEDYRVYNDYVTMFEGEFDKQVEAEFFHERDIVYSANSSIDKLIYSYKRGIIEEHEFLSKYNSILPTVKKYTAMVELEKQYDYISKDFSNRWLLSNPNLNILYRNDSINYYSIFIILVATILCFSTEYNSKMDVYIRASSRSIEVINCKLWLLYSFSIIITIACNMYKLLVFSSFYGIKNLNFPLQSVRYYQSSLYELTIGESIFIKILFEIIGVVLLVCVASLITIIENNAAYSFFLCSSLLIVPDILFMNKSFTYYNPISGLLKGYGYFKGIETTTVVDKYGVENNIIIYNNISSATVITIVVISLIMIVICQFLIKKHIMNIHIRKTKKKAFLFLIICLSLFSGCSKDTYSVVYSPKILENSYCVENEEYVYFSEKNTLYRESKSTGKKDELIRDPFGIVNEKKIISLFLDDQYVYYLYRDKNRLYNIDAINTQTLELNNIYTSIPNYEFKYMDSVLSWNSDINIYNSFFVDKDNIYLVVADGSITKIRRWDKKQTHILKDNIGSDIIFINCKIYYINKIYHLCQYDIVNDYTIEYDDEFIMGIDLVEDNIVPKKIKGM